MPVRHDIDSERELWDAFAESTKEKVFESDPVFCWTQYAGHGPGPELLGNPETVLEIGCGTGRALACLAQLGVKARGLDLSPIMTENTKKRWGPLGVDFVCAEVLDHLKVDEDSYDAIYSIFGAVWFTDPAKLLPLIASRLNPGGVLAFSHPPAIPGAYGPQGMYKGGFAAKAMYAYRYSYTPRRWVSLLTKAGFSQAEARVWEAPTQGHIGTLIARGVKG
ncbi:class I SAM-dependent methyltransferase [Streptomyces sp. NPDC093252]|uniref:class I SAM-dependent methyltransferase n=1 Tax=Streptomyces sp. NPDC093252 TaxID=3154980 RepID=UPI003445D43B